MSNEPEPSLEDQLHDARQTADAEANFTDLLRKRVAELEERLGESGWRPIASAPKDGRMALVYRPLAEWSHDRPVAIKRLVGGNRHSWDCTVPDGETPTNPTDGACHVTHWMPLPEPPAAEIERQKRS